MEDYWRTVTPGSGLRNRVTGPGANDEMTRWLAVKREFIEVKHTQVQGKSEIGDRKRQRVREDWRTIVLNCTLGPLCFPAAFPDPFIPLTGCFSSIEIRRFEMNESRIPYLDEGALLVNFLVVFASANQGVPLAGHRDTLVSLSEARALFRIERWLTNPARRGTRAGWQCHCPARICVGACRGEERPGGPLQDNLHWSLIFSRVT